VIQTLLTTRDIQSLEFLINKDTPETRLNSIQALPYIDKNATDNGKNHSMKFLMI